MKRFFIKRCWIFIAAGLILSCKYPEFNNPITDFRVALSLSPFSLNQFKEGYEFKVNDDVATTPEQLQGIYKNLGSTEMYVRIGTKRHTTTDNINRFTGKEDENTNVHTLDQALELCQIAASLNIPINPEIMCAYYYMDMERQEFPLMLEEEYPELYAIQEFSDIMKDKQYSQLKLDEICTVLEIYAKFVATKILETGCTVDNWNIGNEANCGFAGIAMGLKSAVNPALEKKSNISKYMSSLFSVGWLKENLWNYEAKAMASVKKGVLSAYDELGVDSSKLKFSTHIATVTSTTRSAVSFFKTLKSNGYDVDVAGISFYPSAQSMVFDKWDLLQRTIVRINNECKIPVFIAEFSYPSGAMNGPFKGWNKKFGKYPLSQKGQQDVYSDIIAWGKNNGICGIRYWAPDYKGWYAMSMFEFDDKVGSAKDILLNHNQLI